MNDPHVYHTSPTEGIEIFYPKPYWHTADFSMSGIVKDSDDAQEGMLCSKLFFAISREMMPMFFSSKDVIKHGEFEGSVGHRTKTLLGLEDDFDQDIIVFDVHDKERLIKHSFSIYEFEKCGFRAVPSGEYISDTAVSPTCETRESNVIETTKRYGVHVSFVDDIEGFCAKVRLWTVS